MVDLGLMQAQNRYLAEHADEIYGTDARFAMVHSDKVEYFSNRESLYGRYPHLTPGASPTFGNSPMLVDIGERTNSVEYRKEQLKERKKKVGEDLERIVKEYIEIMDETKKLKIIN